MARLIATRHGCYDAVTCGALDHHTCGSPDPCNAVKPNGIVCTFGTTHRVPVASEADVDAATDAFMNEHVPAQARAAMRATFRPLIRREVIRAPGHEDNAHNEAAHVDAGHAHHAANRAFHDANPNVFGHS